MDFGGTSDPFVVAYAVFGDSATIESQVGPINSWPSSLCDQLCATLIGQTGVIHRCLDPVFHEELAGVVSEDAYIVVEMCVVDLELAAPPACLYFLPARRVSLTGTTLARPACAASTRTR